MLSDATIAQITQRGVKEIISREEFIELLKSGKSLRLKMGFDPSRPDIHLGHVVGLRKLRQLDDNQRSTPSLRHQHRRPADLWVERTGGRSVCH